MFENILFFMSAFFVLGGASMVVLSKNLMHACIFLLFTLFGVAGLYLTLGADFLAAAQLVVYAGGVVILMLFGIMLTGGTENRENRFGIEKIPGMGSVKTYIFAGVSILFIGTMVLRIISNYMKNYQQGELPEYVTTVEKIGHVLLTDHILAFEISSILLLGALIGAAMTARPRKS